MTLRRASALPPIPQWESPGPVSTAFVDAAEAVSVLMGPAGGGKTVTALQRGVLAGWKMPEQQPGLRRARFLVMRQRMTDMEGSTLPSWFRWFPRQMGSFVGKEGSPKRHSLVFAHPRAGRLELEVHFRGIGDQSVDDALRGFEFSFGYVDECDLMSSDVMATLIKRAGRYPSETIDRNPKQVWGSCNAPEPDNWVVSELIDNPRPGWRLYRQPSGLAPDAENLAVLGPDHYRQQAAVLPDYERRRFIENIPGVTRGASVVYESFNPDLHVARAPLEILPGRRLVLGLDAGGTPAAVAMQHAPDGQVRILAELSTHEREDGSVTGPTRFGQALARLLGEGPLASLIRDAYGVADPSAAYGADRRNDEADWMEIVAQHAGIGVRPAATQDPQVRQEALRLPLSRLIEGRRPGLIIDPSCRLLIRALARDYRFRVTAGRRADDPMKNWASHLVEAAQYGALEGGNHAAIMARRQAFARPGTRFARTDFNPFDARRRG